MRKKTIRAPKRWSENEELLLFGKNCVLGGAGTPFPIAQRLRNFLVLSVDRPTCTYSSWTGRFSCCDLVITELFVVTCNIRTCFHRGQLG